LWLAVLLPVAPALILRQRMRAKELKSRNTGEKKKELRNKAGLK